MVSEQRRYNVENSSNDSEYWPLESILGSFGKNVLVTIWHWVRNLDEFRHLPAHNVVAHLSGWVRLKDGAMALAFFAPELGTWV